MPSEPVGPQVERLKRELDRRAALAIRGLVASLWDDLVDGTPVDTLEYTDTPGVLRGNWNFAVDVPDDSFSELRTNPHGPPPPIPATPVVGHTVYMTNSAPYAEVVEYGGYPVPVQRGSWNRALRKYVIKSAGGFSMKAPAGWVRLAAAEARIKAMEIIERLRNLRTVVDPGVSRG